MELWGTVWCMITWLQEDLGAWVRDVLGHFDGQQGGDHINCGDSKTNVVSSAWSLATYSRSRIFLKIFEEEAPPSIICGWFKNCRRLSCCSKKLIYFDYLNSHQRRKRTAAGFGLYKKMVHLSNIPDPELEDEPPPRTLPELCPPSPPNNPVPPLLFSLL